MQSAPPKVERRQIDYAGYTPSYDRNRFAGRRNEYLERVRSQALGHALKDSRRDSCVLDVGCGTGRGLLTLSRLGFTRRFGVDFTSEMLAEAVKKLDRETGRSSVVQGDAFTLPFADATFDLVVSLNFMHMFRFELQQRLVREFQRILKPGGLLVLELESIHKGLFLTRYLEQRRVRSRTKFNSIREVRSLFPRHLFDRRRVIGSVFPKTHVAFQYAPTLGVYLERLAFVTPFNWMASRIVIAARRIEAPGEC